jgi:hypothetical protein
VRVLRATPHFTVARPRPEPGRERRNNPCQYSYCHLCTSADPKESTLVPCTSFRTNKCYAERHRMAATWVSTVRLHGSNGSGYRARDASQHRRSSRGCVSKFDILCSYMPFKFQVKGHVSGTQPRLHNLMLRLSLHLVVS